MTSRWMWVLLIVAGVATVVAVAALNNILIGCDYGSIGLGRPLCEAEIGSSFVELGIALALLAASVVAALVLRRRRN